MSGNGNKKSGGLLKPASWALLLGLLLVLPVSRSFVMAGSFAGSSNNVLPGVVNSGGQDGVSSASNNLISDVEEIGQSTYTSTNYILQPGFGNLMAWPETIQNISASTGAAEGTIDLAWIAPKADGSTGTAAAYAIRYSSVAADSPALSEMQFWLSKPITDFVPVPAPLPCGATQHLIIPGLEGGVTYYFAIKAKADWNAWGYLSGEATSKARLFTPAFSGFSTVETSTIQFNWTADGNLSPGTKFRVLVSTAPDPLDAGGAVVTSSDTYNLFLSSSGLSSNTTYYFRVAGLNKDEAETNYTDARGTSTLAAQPSGFDFVFVSSAVVTMNWNASVNGPGTLYRVYVSTAPDPRDSGGAVVTSSDTYNAYVSTTGLNPDTKYYFRAAAINNNGLITDYSDAVSTTTLAKGVLAAPLAGGLDVYSSSITAHWTLVSGATGYTLAASRNIDITPENIIASSITASFTFATVEELDADTSYYLFVRANGEETNSGWSSYPSAYTLLAYMPAFDKFDNVEANSADFQWSANGNVYPGTKFRVLVSTAPDPMDPGTALVSSSDTYNLSLSTAGLSPNTVYYFRVAGLNKADVATDFITARSTITRVAAPAFSGFTGVSESAVQFNWSPEGNPDGTLYRVYVSTAQDPFNADGAVVTSSDTYNLSLSSTGLYANTTYYFAVAGVNYDGRVTDYTLTVGTSTLLAYDPIFINFTNVDAGAIQFNWSAPDNPDGTLYRVYVSTAQDPFNADGAVVTSSDTYSLSLSSTGLYANTTYYFSVAGINNNGVATDYLARATSTLANMPVSDGFTEVYKSSVQFNWSAPDNPDGTLYRVYVSTAQDPFNADGAVVTSSDTYSLSLSSTGLSGNTTYYFSVAGINNNGVATDYLARATSTLANMPVSDGFTEVYKSSVQFNWSAPDNRDGTLYRVYVSTAQDPFNADGAVVTSSDTYSLSLSSTGLSGNTTYYFSVAGINNNGVATDYLARATSTLAEMPSSDGFTEVYKSSVQFNWSAPDNRDGTLYRVYVSTAPDPFNADGAVVTSSDTYNVSLSTTGLFINTTYYFAVAGINNNGVATDYLARATSTLAEMPSSDGFTEVYKSSVQFNWSAPDNPDGMLYRVYVSTAPDPFNADGAAVTSSDTYTLSLSSTGLSINTTYYFAVAGINNNGVATDYLVRSTSTLAEMPSSDGFTGVYKSSVQFNWSAPDNPDGTLYRVYVSTAPDPFNADGAAVTSSDTYNLSLSSEGLSGNTTYYFAVAAVNNNGVATDYTTAVETSTLLAFIPVFVDFTNVDVSTIQFNWDAGGNTYPGMKHRVLISLASDPLTPGGLATTSSDTYNLSLSSVGLAHNTTYYFVVAGLNNNDVLTGYTEVKATSTLANSPLFSEFPYRTDSSIKFKWSFNDNPQGTLYRVYSSTADNPCSPGVGQDVTISDTSDDYLLLSNLLSQTTYYFQAAAINNNGVVTECSVTESTVTLVSVDTKLYFKTSVSPVTAGARDLTRTMGTTSFTAYQKDLAGLELQPVPPTLATQFTSALTGGTTLAWYTDPLDEVTIQKNVRFNIWAKESQSGANATITAELLRVDSQGNLFEISTCAVRIEFPNTTTIWPENWNGSQVTPTTLSNGDRLAVKIYVDNGSGQDLTVSRNVTVEIEGTTTGNEGDSWVSVSETLAPARPSTSPTGITAVYVSSITAGWGFVRGTTGYTLAAAESPELPPAVVASSTTLGDLSATIEGLDPNTTYYLFVRSNGYGASSSWAAYPGTSTLADTVLGLQIYGLWTTSATINWAPPPPAESYVLEASTEPGFVPLWGSSITVEAAVSTLTIKNLIGDNTYYFRTGTLNWNGSANYSAAVSTYLTVQLGVELTTHTITVGGLVNMDSLIIVTTRTIATNTGNVAETYQLKATTVTTGSPWRIGTTQDVDQYILWGVINDAQPVTVDFKDEDKLGDSYADATDTVFTMGNQTGVEVQPGETREIWFQLGTPFATSTGDSQQIEIRATAIKSP